MNIKSLRAFRATLSEGSLAGASRVMNLSQPAVSRLISSLEGELRLDLFYRTGRRLKPTPEALTFYREAGRILESLDEIPKIAAEIKAGRTESLRVVSMPRIAPSLVSPAVSRFIKEEPDARIKLDVRTRREAGKWLAGREYDLGIGALPIENPDIQTELLIRARAQVVLPRNHPLAEKAQVRAEDIIKEPIIALMHGLLLRNQLDDFFRSAGLVPAYTCEVASSQLACQLTADGAGVTVADSLTVVGVRSNSIVLRPLVPERWMSFGLLFPIKTKLSEKGKKFIGHLKDVSQELTRNDPSLRS